MRVLLILASLILSVAAAELDVTAIRTEFRAALKKRETDDESFSRKLEGWYAAFGQTIKVDHPREHTVYIYALLDATAPDSDLPKLLQQMPGVSDRRGILAHRLKDANLTTIPFDKELWLRKPVWGHHLRYRLLKGFLSQHPPIGRTRADIATILGSPDSTFRDGFTYSLGSELSPSPADMLWVEFTLKDGKVSECRIWHD